MHRRLRRQLEEALGQERDASPQLRKLFRKIDKEYRRADGDRASLQHALALLSDLLQKQPETDRPRPISPKARSVSRLFDQAPFAAVVCDADRKVTAWNAAAEQLFGIPHAEAVGRELSMLVFPDSDATRAQARTELRQALAHGDTRQFLRETPTSSGARSCEWTVVPLHDSKGREVGNAALIQERDPAPDRYALAWQAAGDGIWDWDLGTDRLWLSDSWRAIVGSQGQGEAPSEWLDRVHPADREALQSTILAHLAGCSARFESEHRLRHQDGSWRWVLARGQARRDGEGKAIRFSGSMMDIAEPKLTAVRVVHDALTRLPNRGNFDELLKGAFNRARRRGGDRPLALLLLDVDGFGALNARLGHAAGDEVLMQLVERLHASLGEGDVLARSGADEFAVLVEDVKDEAEAESVARRLQEAAARAFDVKGDALSLTVSVGVALSAAAYTRASDLLADAAAAMYRAKAQGRGRSVTFDPEMREHAPHLLDLEADLRNALARDEFRVHYLPIVDVALGRIQGFEALIRWAHPERGLISPEHFVPFADETGLIVPIGRWLLSQAGRDFESCRRAGSDALTLNVNLSSRQLQHSDLLEHIDGILTEHSLQPEELVLELSENTLQKAEHAERIGELRERGVRLYMDDFGTGACSLNSLLRLQLDSLKIDRSLFSGGSPRGQAPELVRTIVSLARDMGTRVVAEGVETAEQLGFLREVGCAAAQGFYFSPPVDGAEACSLAGRSMSW
jgi:diguanylate cyclase (GGDEF)-like protein/PAS domain S-box-containing protein